MSNPRDNAANGKATAVAKDNEAMAQRAIASQQVDQTSSLVNVPAGGTPPQSSVLDSKVDASTQAASAAAVAAAAAVSASLAVAAAAADAYINFLTALNNLPPNATQDQLDAYYPFVIDSEFCDQQYSDAQGAANHAQSVADQAAADAQSVRDMVNQFYVNYPGSHPTNAEY